MSTTIVQHWAGVIRDTRALLRTITSDQELLISGVVTDSIRQFHR